jgi:hypothetical protein
LNGADQLVAVTGDSVTAYSEAICAAGQGCPVCVTALDPTTYSTCNAGQCEVLDVGDAANCLTDDDCFVRARDCCECDADITPGVAPGSAGGLVAISDPVEYANLVCSPNQACDDCAPVYPPAVTAQCNDNGRCVLAATP